MPLSPNAQNFIEEFSRLPRPLQEVLSSSFLGQVVSDALNLSQVEKEKYDDLMDATSEILMLHLPPSKFEELLIFKYQFSEIQARIINKIISEKIFNPLKTLLKKDEINLEAPLSKKQSIEKQVVNSQKTISQSGSEKLTKFPSFAPPPKKNLEADFSQKSFANNKTSPSSFFEKEIDKNKVLKKQKEEKKETTSLPMPSIQIPEPLEIQIEQPIQQNLEFSQINQPQTSSREREKIKDTLLKIMTSKKIETTSLTEEMKNIEENPPINKTEPKETEKEKALAQISEISEVFTAKDGHFKKPQKETPKQKIPDILKIKIKEEEKKKEEIPTLQQPIPYKKYFSEKEEKPFGET